MKKENEKIDDIDYNESRERVFAELARRHPELGDAAKQLDFKKKRRKKLIAAFTSIGVAAACLAIVLPVTLTGKSGAPIDPIVPTVPDSPSNNNTEIDVTPETPPPSEPSAPSQPTTPSIRFCSEEDYSVKVCYVSAKDYNGINNTSMLYLYDEDKYFYLSSYHYVLKADDEVIMIKDSYETESFQLYTCVTDNHTELTETRNIVKECTEERTVNNIAIFQHLNPTSGFKCYFIYKDYTYYITTDGCFEESEFFAIVENMLSSETI